MKTFNAKDAKVIAKGRKVKSISPRAFAKTLAPFALNNSHN